MVRRPMSAIVAVSLLALLVAGCADLPAAVEVVTVTSTVPTVPAATTTPAGTRLGPAGSSPGTASVGPIASSPGSSSSSGASSGPAAGSGSGSSTIGTSSSVGPGSGASSGPAPSAASGASTASTASTAPPRAAGEFTLALAGDVNFSGRTAELLADDPATALQQAADELDRADITMVNLETAITTGGSPAPKQFHFRAPATALTALAAGGVDVATMANNHAVDYGKQGLADTLAAVADSPIPVIGIGSDADAAYAPYTTTVNGVRVAIIAASQVHDWTLGTWSASATSPGIANADSDRLIAAVEDARKAADVVVVYLHWGIEYQDCPSSDQQRLATALSRAGAAAVVGTHAHILLGAGWRDDGTYVAYGLGNYYWWRSFGNEQDDNGVLTLTFRQGRVVTADFLPTHLDDRGVPLVATGSQRDRILDEWDRVRRCADLSDQPPSG